MLSLGSDFDENINRLTALCGELLDADCALYNRLQDGTLCALGQWHCPVDFNPVDEAEGHICSDVIRQGQAEAVVIRNLPQTSYAQSDPCVLPYNLQSYVGIAVKSGGKAVGALCAVFQRDIEPAGDDKRIMGILASAIGQEEQRKSAEEAVRSNITFLETLIDTIPSPVFYKDTNGIYQGCNRAFAENILGLTRDQIIGKSVHDLPHAIPTDMADVYHKADMLLIGEPGIQVYEAQVRCADDNIHDFIFNKATFTDAAGTVKGLVGVMLDITERKRTGEALKQSEEKWRSLVENAPDIILTLDHDGKILFINRTVPGFEIEKTVGTSVYEYIPPEYRDVTEQSIKNVFQTGEVVRFETRATGPDGADSWYSTRLGPIIHGDEVVAAMQISTDITKRKQMEQDLQRAHDELELRVEQRTAELARTNVELRNEITERKRTEISLRESEQKYRAIFEQAGDSIILFDAETGEILDFNDKTCQTLGYTRDEFAKLKIPDFEVEESIEEVAAHVKRIVDSGSDIFETRHRTKDGHILNILVSTRAVSIGDRKFIQGLWRDITQQKEAEQKLMAYQKQLRSLASELSLSEERLRRRIATDIHDNIGQNLAISRIKLESMSKAADSPKLAKTLAEVLTLLSGAIDSTRSLTFELSPPVLYELGFEAAVEWLLRNVRKQHSLTTEFIDDGEPKPLDPNITVLLFQAVRELLVNVAKHAKANNVTVSTNRVDKHVHIGVADDGIGFDLSKAPHHNYETGGFGLFSIRERLGHVGGRLDIESKTGKGTIATLIAPIDQNAEIPGRNKDEHKNTVSR